MIVKFILLTLLVFTTFTKPNLFLGAGGFGFGCGSNSPLAQRPFSYVRLGPDTSPLIKKTYLPFQHFGGYSTAD
jgi:putative alpha-1,2-mannosidase